MRMSKLISVIIPTYNRAYLVKDAINSVLSQTYQEFEILVVDDGSTDDTVKVVNSFQDERIKYIYQENSGKPSVVRNKGIKEAKGDFIAFLDSDDLWHPEMLEKHINILKDNPDIGFSTNWSLYQTFDGKELFQKKCLAHNQKEYLEYMLLDPDKAYTGTGSSLIRKEILQKAGLFDEEMTFCEDWDLFFRMAALSEIYNIEEILTYVRNHKESISKTPDVTKFKEGYLRFLQKAFDNKNLPKNLLKNKNKAYSNAFWTIGGWALNKSQNYPEARKNLWASLKYSPLKILNIKFLVELMLSCSPKFCLKCYNHVKQKYRKLLGKK